MRAALVALVTATLAIAATGCVSSASYADGEALCQPGAQAPSHARNPATGMCIGFASSCDVPAEWAPCTPLAPCAIDDDCAPTEHCVDQPIAMEPSAPARACEANDACTVETGCDSGLFCDLDVNSGGGECDPTQPHCVPEGTCSRGSSAPQAPPGCLATSECGALEICPAQYGGCSAGTPPTDVACPSVCEPACLTDADCGEPELTGLRCNAEQICGPSTPDERGDDGLACAGWCEPR